MKKLGTKHPIIFGIALVFIALIAAGILTVVTQAVGFDDQAATAAARIIVAAVLILLFRHCLEWGRSFRGLLVALPALVFAVWNITTNIAGGSPFIGSGDMPRAVLLGFAPAIFEEVQFRGIIISKLRASGKSNMFTLWASALIFGLIHLTNIVGGDVAGTLVQTGYAIVVGLVLGAIVIRTGDITSAILMHAATDVSYQLFAEHTESTPTALLIVFIALMAVMTVYAILVTKKAKEPPAAIEE